MAEIEAAKAPHSPNDVEYLDAEKGPRLQTTDSRSDEHYEEKKAHLHEQDEHEVYNPNMYV
jgi:hypothetical protein